MPVFLDEFSEVLEIAETFKNKKDISDILISIIKLFNLLISHSSENEKTSNPISPYNDDLRYIIEWTENNFKEKISLEDISKKNGI